MILSTVRTVLGKVLAPLGIRYYDLYYGRFDLSRPVPPAPGDVTVARAGESDFEAVVSGGDAELREGFARARAIGSECWLAKDGDAIAGYTWINRTHFDLAGLRSWPLPAGVAYHYHSFVFPDFRGRKVFQSMIAVVYGALRDEGWKVAANFVDTRNAPSIRARRKLGATLTRTRILKLPGLKPIWLENPIEPGAPPIPVKPPSNV